MLLLKFSPYLMLNDEFSIVYYVLASIGSTNFHCLCELHEITANVTKATSLLYTHPITLVSWFKSVFVGKCSTR